MATSVTKEGITLTGSGKGNSIVTVSAISNEGLDKEVTFRVSVYKELYRDVTIKHLGRREVFNARDGDFILKDSDTFNVIKS